MEIFTYLLFFIVCFFFIIKCDFSQSTGVNDVINLSEAKYVNDINKTQLGDSNVSDLEILRKDYLLQLQTFNLQELGDELELLLKAHPNPRKTLVGMISIYRQYDEYLYKTLSSVLPALSSNVTSSFRGSITELLKMNVYLGSPSSDYTKFTKFNSMVNIIPMEESFWNAPFGSSMDPRSSPEALRPFKDNHLKVKCSLNFIRMMEGLAEMALRESNSTDFNNSGSEQEYGTLFLEDDVIMVSDAATRLDATIAAIEKVIGKDADYILSCYVVNSYAANIGGSPSNYQDINPSNGYFNYYGLHTASDQFSRYTFGTPEGFYGTQCIYMPAKTAKKASDWMRTNYLSYPGIKNWLPHDHQLGAYSLEFNVPILAMHEPIAQHIGRSTTGVGTYFHQGLGQVQINV